MNHVHDCEMCCILQNPPKLVGVRGPRGEFSLQLEYPGGEF